MKTILIVLFLSQTVAAQDLVFPNPELEKRIVSLEERVTKLEKEKTEKKNEKPNKTKLIPNATFSDYPSLCSTKRTKSTLTKRSKGSRRSCPSGTCPRRR